MRSLAETRVDFVEELVGGGIRFDGGDDLCSAQVTYHSVLGESASIFGGDAGRVIAELVEDGLENGLEVVGAGLFLHRVNAGFWSRHVGCVGHLVDYLVSLSKCSRGWREDSVEWVEE